MSKATCGNAYSGRAPLGVFAAGFNAHIHGYHLEYWQGYNEIGGNISLNPEFPGAPTQNVVLGPEIEVCCGGDPNAYAVDIGANNPVVNSGVWNWAYLTQTDMINDNQTGNLCDGGESTEGYYLLGNNASQVLTTCTGVTNSLNGVAPLASPTFTGTPVAPTPATSDNSTKIATTAYVQAQGYSTGSGGAVSSVFGRTGAVTASNGDYSVSQITGAAALASPSFTGTPVAPTPSTSDNSTNVATTAYVQGQGYLTAVPTCPIWFTQPHASSTVSFSATANKASLWGVVLSCTVTTTQITYDVSTADNTANTYDIGIVNSSGTVVAHVGSTAGTSFAPSVGWKTLSWTASATLPPGKYYLAITSSCTSSCAVLEGGSTGVGLTFAGNQAESVTTGGTLPATITTPSDAYTATTIPVWSVH